MKLAITLGLFLAMSQSFASGYQLLKVEELGLLKHRVIFQSQVIQEIEGTNAVKAKIVTRWGTEVYEVVNGIYACNEDRVCELSSFDRLASFKLCEVTGDKVKCTGRRSSRSSSTGNGSDVNVSENPDEVYDEYDHSRNDNDYYGPEFPARSEGEYSDILF